MQKAKVKERKETMSRAHVVNSKKGQGEIHIIDDWCKGCGYCIAFCPQNVLEASEEFNHKGYHPPVVNDPDNCSLCRTCELICPEFSIWIEKEMLYELTE